MWIYRVPGSGSLAAFLVALVLGWWLARRLALGHWVAGLARGKGKREGQARESGKAAFPGQPAVTPVIPRGRLGPQK
ncbi:hypothetical protein [Salinicola endophyticus]|uniref:hypothetical protein n=1 Tax=Salinicola endophyticus TaxID=1949083 RepID=UPI001300A73E|nr:hypothetical protein [Salinicola endophyticus]